MKCLKSVTAFVCLFGSTITTISTQTQAFTVSLSSPSLLSVTSSSSSSILKKKESQSNASIRSSTTTRIHHRTNLMKQEMVKNRGLESRGEGATPTPGGMTLYIKAGPDGTSVGDCPFAHYIRMILHEKNLEYEVCPATAETKPSWLIDFYGGAMPALRHKKECYIESDVIAQYLDFFFTDVPLSSYPKKIMNAGKDSIDGFFPTVAKYLKCTENGSEQDLELKANLEGALSKIETQLNGQGVDDERSGPFLVGDGTKITLLDCSLAPKLYHLSVGIKAFKDGAIDIPNQFPKLQAYMDHVFAKESFVDALYPEETVVWGWSNARS